MFIWKIKILLLLWLHIFLTDSNVFIWMEIYHIPNLSYVVSLMDPFWALFFSHYMSTIYLFTQAMTTVFESQNNFATLMFSISLNRKNFFFQGTKNFMFFMRFGSRQSFFEKLSSLLPPKFKLAKFQFQIISKPFDRSTSYLVWW